MKERKTKMMRNHVLSYTAVIAGILLLLIPVAGCKGPFNLPELLDVPTGEALSISPETAQLGTGDTIIL